MSPCVSTYAFDNIQAAWEANWGFGAKHEGQLGMTRDTLVPRNQERDFACQNGSAGPAA